MTDRAHRTALLAMDLQRDFLSPAGRLPIAERQIAGVLAAANLVLERCAADGVPVIYIRNAFRPLDPSNLLRNRAAIAGTPGAALEPRVVQVTPAKHLLKRRPDAFSNPALGACLAESGAEELLIAGVFADACVAATARSALRRGFKVTLLTDAIGAASDAARERAFASLGRSGAVTAPAAELVAKADLTRRKLGGE